MSILKEYEQALREAKTPEEVLYALKEYDAIIPYCLDNSHYGHLICEKASDILAKKAGYRLLELLEGKE